MTPRQPYRSPFWQPETTPAEAAPQTYRAARASQPEGHAGQSAARAAARRLAVPASSQHAGYAASDLALFNMLMPTGGQSQPRQAIAIEPRGTASRQLDAAQPERGRNVQAAVAHAYSDADNAKFAKLQAGFADVRSGLRQGDGYQASAVPPTTAAGYSQQDLEAFERLARFGAAG